MSLLINFKPYYSITRGLSKHIEPLVTLLVLVLSQLLSGENVVEGEKAAGCYCWRSKNIDGNQSVLWLQLTSPFAATLTLFLRIYQERDGKISHQNELVLLVIGTEVVGCTNNNGRFWCRPILTVNVKRNIKLTGMWCVPKPRNFVERAPLHDQMKQKIQVLNSPQTREIFTRPFEGLGLTAIVADVGDVVVTVDAGVLQGSPQFLLQDDHLLFQILHLGLSRDQLLWRVLVLGLVLLCGLQATANAKLCVRMPTYFIGIGPTELCLSFRNVINLDPNLSNMIFWNLRFWPSFQHNIYLVGCNHMFLKYQVGWKVVFCNKSKAGAFIQEKIWWNRCWTFCAVWSWPLTEFISSSKASSSPKSSSSDDSSFLALRFEVLGGLTGAGGIGAGAAAGRREASSRSLRISACRRAFSASILARFLSSISSSCLVDWRSSRTYTRPLLNCIVLEKSHLHNQLLGALRFMPGDQMDEMMVVPYQCHRNPLQVQAKVSWVPGGRRRCSSAFGTFPSLLRNIDLVNSPTKTTSCIA